MSKSETTHRRSHGLVQRALRSKATDGLSSSTSCAEEVPYGGPDPEVRTPDEVEAVERPTRARVAEAVYRSERAHEEIAKQSRD